MASGGIVCVLGSDGEAVEVAHGTELVGQAWTTNRLMSLSTSAEISRRTGLELADASYTGVRSFKRSDIVQRGRLQARLQAYGFVDMSNSLKSGPLWLSHLGQDPLLRPVAGSPQISQSISTHLIFARLVARLALPVIGLPLLDLRAKVPLLGWSVATASVWGVI